MTGSDDAADAERAASQSESDSRQVSPYSRWTWPGVVLCCFAVLYTAYLASAILIPITLALLLYLLLAPFVRWLFHRFRVPQAVGATLSLGMVLAAIVTAFYTLAGPASVWAEKLPRAAYQLEITLRDLGSPMEKVEKATKEVEQLAKDDTPQGGGDEPLPVVLKGPSLAEMLLGRTTTITASLLVTVVLLLFLLATGEATLRQAVTALPAFAAKRLLVETVRETEQKISSYLGTITLINIGLGICVGLAMWGLGLPDPELWGGIAAVFNFVPYLGAIAGVALVGLAALATFDAWASILAPPLVYLVLTAVEGQIVTPALTARRLALNPIAVLLSLIVWGWIWGIVGTLLAIPLLAVGKIICDATDTLRPVGTLLGRYQTD